MSEHIGISRVYGTRQADYLDSARLILVNAAERQPDVAIFHYNLACYECQLGSLAEAKNRLKLGKVILLPPPIFDDHPL